MTADSLNKYDLKQSTDMYATFIQCMTYFTSINQRVVLFAAFPGTCLLCLLENGKGFNESR